MHPIFTFATGAVDIRTSEASARPPMSHSNSIFRRAHVAYGAIDGESRRYAA
jgi:hypothetical protein